MSKISTLCNLDGRVWEGVHPSTILYECGRLKNFKYFNRTELLLRVEEPIAISIIYPDFTARTTVYILYLYYNRHHKFDHDVDYQGNVNDYGSKLQEPFNLIENYERFQLFDGSDIHICKLGDGARVNLI